MANSAITSDLKAASAAIAVGRNKVNSITVLGDGTNAPTLILYDNATTASGKVLAKIVGVSASTFLFANYSNPVVAENGIYASLSGTGANYIVTYGA